MIKKTIVKGLNLLGYDIVKHYKMGDEFAEFRDLYDECKEYTRTGIEKMYSLYKSVEYIVKNNIEGDFVECGVWRGGCCMLMAKTLLKFNSTSRKIYMYDTYEGMSDPTEKDVDAFGHSAKELMKVEKKDALNSVWCIADLNDVKNNMSKTKYPSDKLIYIEGKVEDTLPGNSPKNSISLLRLDTDFYESTAHELKALYPMLVPQGVLILDDYGYWQGARKAVDEYFASQKKSPLLNRIDNSSRTVIKI